VRTHCESVDRNASQAPEVPCHEVYLLHIVTLVGGNYIPELFRKPLSTQVMARIKSPPLPPSPEACEHLLAVIRSSVEPLPASAIARLIVPPFQMTPRHLVPLLEDYVAAGKLYVLPAKTTKARPRYWHRDARVVSRAAVFDFVQAAQAPFTVRDVARGMASPIKITVSELKEILDESVAAGKLHSLPPKTPRGQPRYWKHDLLEFGRQAILGVLDAKGPQTETQLARVALGLSTGRFQQVLQAALAAREIWRYPAPGKTKKELFGRAAPSPEPYLRDVGRQLATIVVQLKAANVSPADLRRALVQLIESAGIPFTQAATSNNESLQAAVDPDVDLIGLMRRIEPAAERGALVVARDLRRAARLDKSAFDRAVLELARKGRLALHRHDYAASLSPAERDDLVTDGAGTYYVGMVLRHD
jgi:hypothetical protein